MKKTTILWIVGSLLVVGALVSLLVIQARKPGKYDTLAQCIADSGAKFYGAFWCPHCQAQKAMFGKSAKKLPYVECSEPNGKEQLPICKEAKIEGYPTWKLADNTLIPNEDGSGVSIETLATKTNCRAALAADTAQ